MDDQRQLCSFYLGGMCYGLPIEHVVEVSRCPTVVPVPSSPPAIAGLMNIRSQIVTAVDLGVRLGLTGCNPETIKQEEASMLILVRDVDDELVGLRVDSIEDVIEVSQIMFEPSPLTLSNEIRSMVPGAYKVESRLVMLVELGPTLTLSSRPQPAIGL